MRFSGAYFVGMIALFAIFILSWKIIDSPARYPNPVTGSATWQGSSNPPLTESEREKPDAADWSDTG